MSSTEPVRVTIFNQTYSLVASGPAGEIEELAQMVDELMRDIARSGNLDSTRTAVLTCLHLADQVRMAQRELEGLKRVVDAKVIQFNTLLDVVIDDEPLRA